MGSSVRVDVLIDEKVIQQQGLHGLDLVVYGRVNITSTSIGSDLDVLMYLSLVSPGIYEKIV